MSTHKNVVKENLRKTPDQIRRELEARIARLKAQPVDPVIKNSVALREAVSDNVFEIMQKQGITQAELARRMGKSRAHVCKILGGANLTLETLATLSEALECRIEVQFEKRDFFTANMPLSTWKHLERPGLELIRGGLPSGPSPSRELPEFDKQIRFISDKTKFNDNLTTDQKVTHREIERAA